MPVENDPQIKEDIDNDVKEENQEDVENEELTSEKGKGTIIAQDEKKMTRKSIPGRIIFWFTGIGGDAVDKIKALPRFVGCCFLPFVIVFFVAICVLIVIIIFSSAVDTSSDITDTMQPLM